MVVTRVGWGGGSEEMKRWLKGTELQIHRVNKSRDMSNADVITILNNTVLNAGSMLKE